MAGQTKFEAVPTKATDFEDDSLSSTVDTGYEIKAEPEPLSSWQAGKIFGVVMDVLAIATSCVFFAYALAVKMHQRVPMLSPQVQLLVRVSKLVSVKRSRPIRLRARKLYDLADKILSKGPTIYPILFAAIIGRALKPIAFWKLERGGRIGTLDRLLGSMTIVQAVLTQVQMRSVSLLGLALIAVWSLSPLGGQASLRIISSVIQPNDTTRPLQYVNTSSSILSLAYAGSDSAAAFVPVNVLFGAAMLGTSSTSSFSVDNWGNLKIPWIENMDPAMMDDQGWYNVTESYSSDDFTSLIGVPLSRVSDAWTTSFSIETSYWTLDCPILEDMGAQAPDVNESSNAKLGAEMDQFVDADPVAVQVYNTTTLSKNFWLYSTELHNALDPWEFRDDMKLRHITYLDQNNYLAHWVGANCTIKTTYVEVNVLCSTGSCTAVGMRNSRKPHPSKSWTAFDIMAYSFYWFGPHFAQGITSGHIGAATPYQKFIIDPLNPFNGSFAIPPLTAISNAKFALRLGQLLNTYWMAMLAPTAIPKGLRNSNISADTAIIFGTELLNTTAKETRGIPVLRCNMVWFVVLLLSSAITAFIGLCGLVAAVSRLGPDIGFNISSLVKDSSFEDQISVPTTLGSTDRSILMKDWYAKLGDVAAEDDVGYIAIGSGNVANLQRGRLYR